MKTIFSFLFLVFWLGSNAQGFLTVKGIHMDFSGFVRNDFIFDSRRNLGACDDLFELYPLKPELDQNGKDLNDVSSAKFLNTFSRFGTRFRGLEIGKAKISAYIEFDFTGSTMTPTLRLRHANTQIEWPTSKLLIGRTWHPLFIEKVYPATLNENTGLPFQVFNRSPQIRFTHTLTKNLDMILAAVYQYDYSNAGPNGKTYQYQRDGIVPDLSGQLQFYNENWVIGGAIDFKSIRPRTYTTVTNAESEEVSKFKTNEKLNTIAALVYLKYTKDKFLIMAKSMYGQNVCEHLLPSGYYVASLNSATGAETYTPLNHIYNWVNFTYGKTLKFGMYIGYLKNLGTSVNPVTNSPFYGMTYASGIDMIYKFSPQLIYSYKNFMFGVELSYTNVAYGSPDYNNKAKVIVNKNEQAGNFRNMISAAYYF